MIVMIPRTMMWILQRQVQQQQQVQDNNNSKTMLYNNSNDYEQYYVPLDDPLISRVIDIVPSYLTSSSSSSSMSIPSYVPTVACGVLEHIIKQRGSNNLSLVMADFNWLPPPDNVAAVGAIGAVGQPLVTSMDGIDYENYLLSPPMCDILFPTDFEKLASFVKRTLKLSSSSNSNTSKGGGGGSNSNVANTNNVVRVQSQSDFLQQFGSNEIQKTKSWITGYTPLLHDFSNCSVLTISK